MAGESLFTARDPAKKQEEEECAEERSPIGAAQTVAEVITLRDGRGVDEAATRDCATARARVKDDAIAKN